MSEPLIEREEVVALLFAVNDISITLINIDACWEGTTMKRKRPTDADRARQEQALRNAARLRELAEKAQAELDRRKHRESA